MMKKLFPLIILPALCVVASAQQKPAQPQQQKPAATAQAAPPEVPPAWAEQVKSAMTEAELLKAKAEAAQAKAEGLVYQVMALLKLSPEEWKPVLDGKGLRFERIAPATSPPK
jgi:hypothetical protein